MEVSTPPARPPVSLPEARIAVRGVGGPVLQAGTPGAREAVLFLHGNPGSGDDFKDLLEETATFARAVAPHMPGFGRADKPRDFGYDLRAYADHIEGLLEQLGIERVHLVLHDLGGPWGLEWAARDPDRVASATLIGTGVLVRYRWHFLARVWRTPVAGELLQATANRPMVRLLTNLGQRRKLPRAFLDHMHDVNFTRATRRAVLRVYRNMPDPAADGARQAAALRPHDLPALVLWGPRDPYLGVELAEAQREAFPSARVVLLGDSGHWPFVDDPEATREEIIPFLRHQLSSSATKGSAS